MADEKIDSLTIGIGLTTEDFQAGIDKIMEGISGMRQSTEAAAEGMGASFAGMADSVSGLALKFTGLFFAVRGIEDVIGYFKNLSHELAQLSFAGEYLGQSSVQLSRFGEVARLAGGHAEDAITAVQGLQSAIFGLEYQGQMSQNLLMLNRLRVAYLDERGHMLPIEQIAMNAAKALQQQLPGKANEAMRVQWAVQIFGPGGLANAVGGGVAELRKFYAESTKDQKSITQRAMDEQRHLQQSITRLSYDVKNEATKALNALTPVIQALINEIKNSLIPTIQEVITDFEDWLHPKKLVDNAMSGKGVGPLGILHPINSFEAIGIGLGIRAAQFHEWWKKQIGEFEISKLAAEVPVPASVSARIAPNTNLDALRLLHIEEGGDAKDPTWSKAITAYAGVAAMPGGAAAYVQEAAAAGRAPSPPPPPGYFRAHHGVLHIPATPGAARPAQTLPAAAHSAAAAPATRVTIGTVNVNAPQAKDANGIAAAMHRAMERKLLAAQADPGLQ